MPHSQRRMLPVRESTARQEDRLLAREARELLRIAGPIILSQLGGVGMLTMDTIMVGPLGAQALAASGLANSLHMAVVMMSTGTLLGMGPLVSRAFGAGDRWECRHVLVQGLWLALVLAIPLMAINFLGEPLSVALGQPEEVSALAGGYMTALAWGVPPLLLFTALRNFLEGMGIAKPAMVITFLGLAVNLIGNQVLIYGIEGWIPAFGVVGSGWATTLVRYAMLAAMATYLLRHRELHPFEGVRFSPEGTMFRRIVKIGIPSGAQMGLEVGLFSFAAVMMGWFGAVELGTHQVTLNIAATTFMVALGVSLAGSIRVGQNLGAGDPAGARRAVLLTFALSVGFMGLCGVAFLGMPETLLRLYTDDPSLLKLGRELLFMAALFQLFDGAQVAGFSVLRGAGDTRVPMILAALAYWAVGAPAAYLLGFHSALGPSGIWAGLCISLAVASALLVRRIRRVLY
ncbi:MAG: MATE family efflux transporter [Gemmatimonadetes bacterium]|nr:MATE family efflux transporter [Gemmatimonadota bacterium]